MCTLILDRFCAEKREIPSQFCSSSVKQEQLYVQPGQVQNKIKIAFKFCYERGIYKHEVNSYV